MLSAYVSMPRVSWAADHGCHELRQALTLIGRKVQAELRAPPQHVVLGLRPFALHEIAHLRAGEIGTQARPEVLEAARGPEHAVDARPVGSHQPPRLRLTQKRPRPARLRYEARDAVPRELAARQARVPGPCRSSLEEMSEAIQRLLGQAPIGRDLAAVDRQQRRLALVEGQDIVAADVLRPLGPVVVQRTHTGE